MGAALFLKKKWYKEVVTHFFFSIHSSFNVFMNFSNCIRANLIANFGIQFIFTLLGLLSFAFFLLNQKIVMLIGENKVNSIDNFFQVAYNLISLNNKINEINI